MWAGVVVEGEILVQTAASIGDSLVVTEVDIFVFYCAPQAFDHYIVNPATATVMRDNNAVIFQIKQKRGTSELASLI